MEFIKGADVSSLQAMEDYGAKFYDLNGNEADALAILQGHGVNYIRLRLFHQPTRSFDGGDYCDLPHTVLMAKRTKARGWASFWISITVTFGRTGRHRPFRCSGRECQQTSWSTRFMHTPAKYCRR